MVGRIGPDVPQALKRLQTLLQETKKDLKGKKIEKFSESLEDLELKFKELLPNLEELTALDCEKTASDLKQITAQVKEFVIFGKRFSEEQKESFLHTLDKVEQQFQQIINILNKK